MQKRRRFKQTLSLQDRLAAFAGDMREKADAIPPGPERDSLLKRAGQADNALDLTGEFLSQGKRPGQ